MVVTEKLALQAARLYSQGSTQDKISKELETSKARVAKLIREGIKAMDNHARSLEAGSVGQPEGDQENQAEPKENPGAHLGLETYPPQTKYSIPFPQKPSPEAYTLETSGIPKQIILTPKALMIFEIWTACGFDGDLSDFLEDAVNYLYETRKPSDRRNYG